MASRRHARATTGAQRGIGLISRQMPRDNRCQTWQRCFSGNNIGGSHAGATQPHQAGIPYYCTIFPWAKT